MSNTGSTRLGTPPDSIAKKEQELTALLVHVLAAPLGPVQAALNSLIASAALTAEKLKGLASEVSATDYSVQAVGKSVEQALERVLEKHVVLEDDLGEAFRERKQAEKSACDAVAAVHAAVRDVLAETAQATQLADDAAASIREAFRERKQAEETACDAVAGVHAAVRDVLAETARATQLADDAAASIGRDRELLDTCRAARNDAQRAAQAAASRGRILLWLLVAVLAATCGDIAINVAALVHS